MPKKGFISGDFGRTVQLLPHPHDTFGENKTSRNVRFTLVDNSTGSQCPECLSLVRFYVHKPQMSHFRGDVTVLEKGLLGACGRLRGLPKVSRDSFLHFPRDRWASMNVFCSMECLQNGQNPGHFVWIRTLSTALGTASRATFLQIT